MRWERLFADLESGLEAAAAAELDAEVADRTRREDARVRLVDRLRPVVGQGVTLGLPGLGPLAGTVVEVGAEWVLLQEPGRQSLVPIGALSWVEGLGLRSHEPGSEGAVAARRTLRSALRALSRDRSEVLVALRDGGSVVGTIDRVGADFIEVAVHPGGEQRRPGAVRVVSTVPTAALVAVRSR